MSEPAKFFDGEGAPKCPLCGFSDSEWWDGQPEQLNGDAWYSTCPNCDKDYVVTMWQGEPTFDTKE